MLIKLATVEDAEAILAIYAPYVRNTAITFEYDVPDIGEFRTRIESTLKNYPYLVAVEDGRIVGYAYAGAFRKRAAYQHSAEMSIYLDEQHRQHGIGRLLYQELEKRLLEQNVFSVYAGVTTSDRENDAFVTDASIRFHEKTGYTKIGEYHLCGYKFGQWYNVAWFEKALGIRPGKPNQFISFAELQKLINYKSLNGTKNRSYTG